MLLNDVSPVGVDYPSYFDGDIGGGQWTSDQSDSPSVTFAGARRCYGEVVAAIPPDSMAGGTRAEFDVEVNVPSAFWEDVSVSTFSADVTGLTSTLDLTVFDGMTAPLEDAVIEVTLQGGGTSTATFLKLVDVDSGAWLNVATPNFLVSTKITVDAPNFAVRRGSTSIIRQVTKAGPARFFTLNTTPDGMPKLQVIVDNLTGTLNVKVTGRRKYQIA
jgi:hypothetical protein